MTRPRSFVSCTRFAAAVVLALGFFSLASAQPVSAPAIAAPSYLLLDVASGQAIVAEKAGERHEPASLTKLMTAYLTFAALRDKTIALAQMVPVSAM